ncbi:unnamed protein product [Sphagnum troendelagicum]|uniref:Uncharacterized protein n=1 Tax=Sphagnum jensenii TaxID=128206 RepID=A0ABP0VWW3_9BRYO
MHLVTGSETYKTASRVVTQVLGRVDEKMNSETLGRDVAVALEDTPLNGGLDVDFEKLSLGNPIMTGQTDTMVLDLDTDTTNDCEGGHQLVEPIDDEPEFGNTELENLVLVEGPQQILQLILQKQADDFMEEEIADADDYADWIKWVSDAEKGKQAIFETVNRAEVPVLL